MKLYVLCWSYLEIYNCKIDKDQINDQTLKIRQQPMLNEKQDFCNLIWTGTEFSIPYNSELPYHSNALRKLKQIDNKTLFLYFGTCKIIQFDRNYFKKLATCLGRLIAITQDLAWHVFISWCHTLEHNKQWVSDKH